MQQLREQGGSSAAVHPPENAAQRLGAALGQAFGLTLPTEEVQYLEQYLAAYITGYDGEKWGAGEMHLRHLTRTADQRGRTRDAREFLGLCIIKRQPVYAFTADAAARA